jgi:hypothetical protein
MSFLARRPTKSAQSTPKERPKQHTGHHHKARRHKRSREAMSSSRSRYHSSITGFTNAAFNSATKGTIRRKLTRTDLLGQIEETGWRLQHADRVYVQTGQNSRDKFMASGQHVVVTGEVIGIYLFRRDDTRVDRATGPNALDQKVPATTSDNDVVRVKCFKCHHPQDVPAAQGKLLFVSNAARTSSERSQRPR